MITEIEVRGTVVPIYESKDCIDDEETAEKFKREISDSDIGRILTAAGYLISESEIEDEDEDESGKLVACCRVVYSK